MVSRIFGEALVNGKAHDQLRVLCKNYGPRLSGSPGAAAAVEYTYQVMLQMRLDSVWKQPCMVPHWERGTKERASILNTQIRGNVDVKICALGGSVATPAKGLRAEVIEIHDFDELKKIGKKGVEGKIVFYNHPFDNSLYSTFAAYSEAVRYRWQGPSEAQKLGAVGVIVRSMTNAIDDHPHTGVMRYDSLGATIPSAAISTRDAELLSHILKTEGKTFFYMEMNCQKFPDILSYNVIGEIRGSKFPNEVIAFGGHLDAWDLGEGAHDDGAGCMQAIEVLRIFKAQNIRPQHTIRAVMWMNEENGGRGGAEYARVAAAKKEKHLAAIESDAGGFSPRGFGTTMKPEQRAKVMSWGNLFLPYGIHDLSSSGGGADIEDLAEAGTPLLGLEPDGQRYFDYHHTEIDVWENVNRRELLLGAGAIAAMVYLIDTHGL